MGATSAVIQNGNSRRNQEVSTTACDGTISIPLGPVDLSQEATVEILGGGRQLNPVSEEVFGLLDRAQIPFGIKEQVMAAVANTPGPTVVPALEAMDLPGNLRGALTELIAASHEDRA